MTPSSAFGSTGSAFGAGANAHTSASSASSASSDPFAAVAPKAEDLPEEIRNLFLADAFEWGMVPGVEPPVSVR